VPLLPPERRQIFDVNDFDETLTGPWEWDVKGLAASVILAGRENGYSALDSRQAVLSCLRYYREYMQRLAQMSHLDVWYYNLDVDYLYSMVLLPSRVLPGNSILTALPNLPAGHHFCAASLGRQAGPCFQG